MPLRADIPAKEPNRRNLAQLPPEMIARAKAGDRAAMEALLTELYPYVREMIYRFVGPSPEIEDLQQTALMQLSASLPSYRGDSSLSTWVGQICVFVSRDHFRRTGVRNSARDSGLIDALAGNLVASGGTHDRVAARQQLESCQRILDEMSPNHRLVFVLKTALGYSIDEIAEMTKSAKSTTRLRLYYARKVFHRALGRGEESK